MPRTAYAWATVDLLDLTHRERTAGVVADAVDAVHTLFVRDQRDEAPCNAGVEPFGPSSPRGGLWDTMKHKVLVHLGECLSTTAGEDAVDPTNLKFKLTDFFVESFE